MSRGARAVARLLAGAPATSVNLDDLDSDWRPLAEVLLDAPDRGAALEAALAHRPDGDQRWAELLTADVLSPDGDQPERTTRLLTIEELEQLPAPRWLVHNHLVAETISVLFGPSGGGKTFVALDLALTVATGQPWLGTEAVEGGYVVYATGEGLAGLARRIQAWRAAHGHPSLERFRVLPVAVQFMDAADLEQLRADLRSLPEAPKLIIVDTLARSMIGAEENSAKDMGLFLDGVEQITREWGAHVLLVHHTGKNGETERGTSALRGFVQTMLKLVGEDGLATLSCDKQKDGAAPFEPHVLRPGADRGRHDVHCPGCQPGQYPERPAHQQGAGGPGGAGRPLPGRGRHRHRVDEGLRGARLDLLQRPQAAAAGRVRRPRRQALRAASQGPGRARPPGLRSHSNSKSTPKRLQTGAGLTPTPKLQLSL